MAVFESLLQVMINSGGYYIFIWLLFAALMYGVLEKYEVFGDSSATGGAALGASFFVLLSIYAFAPQGLFLNFGAALGFIMMAIFGVIILLSFSGINVPDLAEAGDGDLNLVAGAGLILVLIAFIGALAFNLDWSGLLGGAVGEGGSVWEDVAFPIIFLVFLLIVMLGAMDGGD